MRTRIVGPVLVAVLLVLSLAPAASAAGTDTTVEALLLKKINAGRASLRKAPLTLHSGLRTAARGHSLSQARAGRLSHNGFRPRIDHAAPAPRERSGAPDDGFYKNGFGACENVGYAWWSRGATAEQAAETLYQGWKRSTPHRKCMFGQSVSTINVAGVGVYRDSRGKWWATLEAVKDASRP